MKFNCECEFAVEDSLDSNGELGFSFSKGIVSASSSLGKEQALALAAHIQSVFAEARDAPEVIEGTNASLYGLRIK